MNDPDTDERSHKVVLVLARFVALSGVFPARLVDYVHAAASSASGVAKGVAK